MEDELVSVGEGAVGVLQSTELISEVLEQRGHQTLVSRRLPQVIDLRKRKNAHSLHRISS